MLAWVPWVSAAKAIGRWLVLKKHQLPRARDAQLSLCCQLGPRRRTRETLQVRQRGFGKPRRNNPLSRDRGRYPLTPPPLSTQG